LFDCVNTIRNSLLTPYTFPSVLTHEEFIAEFVRALVTSPAFWTHQWLTC